MPYMRIRLRITVSGVTTALNHSCTWRPDKVCERGVGVNGHVAAFCTVRDVVRGDLDKSVALIGSRYVVAGNAVSVRMFSAVLECTVRTVVTEGISE